MNQLKMAETKRKILLTYALPYANGSIHLGPYAGIHKN